MAPTSSLKTDPLGAFDTRLTMNQCSTGDFASISSAPAAGFDGAAEWPPDRMGSESSPKPEYRILELRKSFGGFNVSQKCPRLELDAAVDRCHLLDNLSEPADPQNTPASNSVRECTPECLPCGMENKQESPVPQIDELKFDCFRDSPVKRLVVRRDDEIERSNDPVFEAHGKLTNRSAFRKPANTGEARYVRFGAVPSPLPSPLSSPPRVTRRPLPSIERKRDYITTYRQKKQCDKWRIARRPTPRKRVSRNPAFEVQILGTLTPPQTDRCNRSLSSSPFERNHVSPPTRSDASKAAIDATVDVVQTAPGISKSTVVRDMQQNKQHLKVSLSIYRNPNKIESSAVGTPKYACEFRSVKADITDLPRCISLQFPWGFEQTFGPVTVEHLVLRADFEVPRMAIRLALSFLSTAKHELESTRAGTLMLSCFTIMVFLWTNAVALILSQCGVALSYHQLSYTAHED